MQSNNRILVIDDDPELLKTYCAILQPKLRKGSLLREFAAIASTDEGDDLTFEVVTASQGAAGVEEVNRALAAKGSFAAAFVDAHMPPGINGLETIRRIRALDDRIYLILVTAYSDHSVDELQTAARHDIILARKPMTQEEVFQMARNACLRWNEDRRIEELHTEDRKTVSRVDQIRWFLKEVIDALPQALILCSPKGEISYINHALVKMTKRQPAHLVGMTLQALFPYTDVKAILDEIIYTLTSRHHHLTLIDALGNPVRILLTGHVICQQQGRVSAVILTLQETDRLAAVLLPAETFRTALSCDQDREDWNRE